MQKEARTAKNTLRPHNKHFPILTLPLLSSYPFTLHPYPSPLASQPASHSLHTCPPPSYLILLIVRGKCDRLRVMPLA